MSEAGDAVAGLVAGSIQEYGNADKRLPKETLRADASQYFALIGRSSAGNSEITRQPVSVTTTSSSMRAPE
jgi:hypothetical protein